MMRQATAIAQRWVLTSLLLSGAASATTASGQSVDQKTVIGWLHSGSEAVRRGDLSGGEKYFRQVVESAPNLSDGYLALGMVELRESKVDNAVTSLRRATELNPNLHGAHMFLGIAEFQKHDLAAAAGALEAEVTLQPKDAEALTWLGLTKLEMDDPEGATLPLDRAFAASPNNPEVLYYRARAHRLVAEQSYTQLRTLDPDSVYVHRALAETLAASGEHEKAVEELNAAILKEPENVDLYETLGEEQERLSRFDDATGTYQQVLKLHPTSAIALCSLGRIDVEHGKAEEGVGLLRQAQKQEAAAGPCDFYLGLGLSETGHPEEAAHWLEASLQNNPSPFIMQSAYYQLVRVYQRLGRKDDSARALEQVKRLKAQAAETVTGASAPGGVEPADAAPRAHP